MKALTIRQVDARLAKALEREKKRRGTSLNQTVLDLLRQSVGVDPPARAGNGLRRLAGTWSADDLSEFEANTASFRQIDEELWR